LRIEFERLALGPNGFDRLQGLVQLGQLLVEISDRQVAAQRNSAPVRRDVAQ